MFRDAGCRGVRTHIQSGNVVFESTPALARRLPGVIDAAVSEHFGFDARLQIRTLAELTGVVEHNPFLERGAETRHLHVVFLQRRPSPSRVALLDPDRFPPDEFVVRDREIYLCCPDGVARSKLTAQYFDSMLRTTSTSRNWNTVAKLLELARGG